MRFVDEYRAPEQVMQLIAHLRERAHCSVIPRSAATCDGGLWRAHPCHL
jgi:hydrogenase expression/formation protein HypD